MRAIVLAAGQGSRMNQLTQELPKCLLQFGENTILTKLRKQLHEVGITDIQIVVGYKKEKIFDEIKNFPIPNEKITFIENKNYLIDTNIHSLSLALLNDESPFYLFEGDIVFDDQAIYEIVSDKWFNKSIWFTSGDFKKGMYGGILCSDNENKISDIKIVKDYNESFSEYEKLIGVMRVNETEVKRFKDKLINKSKDSFKSYYLNAWFENLDELPCYSASLKDYKTFSFNTKNEYENAIDKFYINLPYEFVKVSKLKCIEEFDPNRVDWLKDKIVQDGIWTEPLKIEMKHHLILDGHHRFEVAKLLGLTQLPCEIYDYDNVPTWSLRSEIEISKEEVARKALIGDIYPYKTVKHQFYSLSKCSIKLGKLKENS